MPDIDEYIGVYLCQELNSPDIDPTYLDIAIRFDKTEALRSLIDQLYSLSRYEEAIIACNTYRNDLNDQLVLMSYLAVSNMKLGKNLLALSQFEQVVDLFLPKFGRSKISRNYILKRMMNKKLLKYVTDEKLQTINKQVQLS